MPQSCPTCKTIHKHGSECIRCDNCLKWFHLSCTSLTKNQFDIFVVDENFEWLCTTCLNNTCFECNSLYRSGNYIQCNICLNKFHPSCCGLNKKALTHLEKEGYLTIWSCNNCNNNNLPFNSTPSSLIEKNSFNSLNHYKHPHKLRTITYGHTNKLTNTNFIQTCSVCLSKIQFPNKAVPCPTCLHLIHKKCCNLTVTELTDFKRTKNVWECSKCYENKFPFHNLGDDVLNHDAFNSNWSCQCKSKTSIQIDSEVLRLVINFNNQENNDFTSPLFTFDDNVESFHSIEPDFKYYSTHEFHKLSTNVSNCFSVLHTNICSLQYNGDNLHNLLADLEFKFDIVAVTETWNPENKKERFTPSILPGYATYIGTT